MRASPTFPAESQEAAVGSGQPHEEYADEQLIVRAQAGDNLAFELLVRKYQSKIIRLAGRLVGEMDAADVAQETFIKAHRALSGFRGESAFYTWLHRIGTNIAKNHVVSRLRRPIRHDIDISDAEQHGHDQLSDINTPESLLLADEIRRKLAELMLSLPPDLRQAITLREFEGFTYEQIAEVMQSPIGTVRSRIFRAREAIDVVIQPLLA
jgi:RNA polymerase sigma-70 factor (ECF subfamily)